MENNLNWESVPTLDELEKQKDKGLLSTVGYTSFYPTESHKVNKLHWWAPLSEIHLMLDSRKQHRITFDKILWGKEQ